MSIRFLSFIIFAKHNRIRILHSLKLRMKCGTFILYFLSRNTFFTFCSILKWSSDKILFVFVVGYIGGGDVCSATFDAFCMHCISFPWNHPENRQNLEYFLSLIVFVSNTSKHMNEHRNAQAANNYESLRTRRKWPTNTNFGVKNQIKNPIHVWLFIWSENSLIYCSP